MAPKKNDTEVNMDQLQQQMSRVVVTEMGPTMGRVDSMEQRLQTMREQLNSIFARWEQKAKAKEEEQRRLMEKARGKSHASDETRSEGKIGQHKHLEDGEQSLLVDQTPIDSRGNESGGFGNIESSICLLNCGPTGSEALKNLVLGGVGSITVVDGSKVELGDLGNNFMGIFPAHWFLLLASMELIISYVDFEPVEYAIAIGNDGKTKAVDVIAPGGGGGVECYNCREVGHMAKDCRGGSGGNRYGGRGYGGEGCYTCGDVGHFARDCRANGGGYVGGGGGGGNTCYTCGGVGHMARVCTSKRQSGGGGGGACYECGGIGHLARDCDRRGRGGGGGGGGKCFTCGEEVHFARNCSLTKKKKSDVHKILRFLLVF
ncbi:hypothetical protein F2Q70_00035234 [Brassica cretica]|uniref:CCHC-type domain-containing protein n=1 Tax=Brassica cretica TaxID=69181 RepID=A0A8S9JZ08_BRACR|nr:hypothetical protein F2Q70_00035234 [Brassica cretica]